MSVTTLGDPRRVRVALRELDAAIERAERSQADQLANAELLARAGGRTAGVLIWLRRTDAHLDALRRDRSWLLDGEATAGTGADACRPAR